MSKSKKNHSTEQNANSSVALYGISIIATVIAAIALFLWNSNIFQNNAPAATINGEEYSAAEVNYYYNSVQQYQAYMSMMGSSSYNYSAPAKDQMYDEDRTWHDMMVEQAVESLRQDVALADLAEKDGYTLSEEGQASVTSTLADLDASWVSSGYANRKSYLKAVYGSTMTEDKLVECLNRAALASEYYTDQQASYEYTQDDLNSYYAENKNALDTFVVSQFLFQANVDTTDEKGNTIEMTDDEKTAALDAAKQKAKASAEALLTRLNAGEDAQTLMDEFSDELGYSFVSQVCPGSSINSKYADWAYAAANGATTLVDYEGTSDTSYIYCVARVENRYQDNTPSANIRHILISAGTNPTEEKYKEALAEAEKLLDQFKAGEVTEDAFAKLAVDNSDDSNTAANGGLLNVTSYAGLNEAFVNWALQTHTAGDTTILKNDTDYTKGYHIMYYVDQDLAYWMQNAEMALRNQDMAAWEEEVFADYTVENGDGLKNVG